MFGRFAQFTDPRQGIERLNDNIPILLMPVRLETRFKTVDVAGAAPVNQLWVRVYPDDCWIDSFDPVLTETEVANARTYWIGIWKAGGIEDQERAAWRTLASSHGSGRAAWIISQYQPVNAAPTPAKPRAQDVILTIATETPLGASEATAANTFWRDVWLADGEAAAFFQGFLLPTLFHTDPRYFRKGEGSAGHRIGYAMTRVFVTRTDSGHPTFNASEFLGAASSAALSTVYYPRSGSSTNDAVSRAGLGVAADMGWNVFKEFWPDIKKKFHH